MIDLACSAGVLIIVILMAGAYTVRLLLLGAAHFDRVNQAGSSVLLSKSIMEMTYWGIQPIANLCVAMNLSANMITLVSLGTSLVAAIALASAHFGVASVFILLSFLCDALDGIVARATHTASEAGEVFDAAVDRYVEFFLIGGLIFYYRSNPFGITLALLALLGSFMISYGTAKGEAIHVVVPRGSMRRAERALYLGLGTIFTSFMSLSPYPLHLPAWCHEPPLLVALGLIGTVGNLSAALRLRAVIHAVKQARHTAPPEPSRPIAVVPPPQPEHNEKILWNRAV